MVEVVIDSIRVSLISQHRIVMLRDVDGERQLPIWIGPCEAESITLELQDSEVARPLTHDLVKNIVETLNGKVSHILINELKDSIFYARLYVDVNGELIDIDCRPSDAIAVAVRATVPIFIDESVMEEVGILPEPDISDSDSDTPPPPPPTDSGDDNNDDDDDDDSSLDAFSDFITTLDFD